MLKKIFIVLTISIVVLSCTRYDNPAPIFEEYDQEEEDNTIKRKVLVISIDGLVGKQIENKVPDNIKGMLTNSKYSFDALTDENTSDPASWASMMTGVHYTKHNVITDSYLPTPNTSNSHDVVDYVPTIFQMINLQNSKLYTVSVTQNLELASVLLMDAKKSLSVKNDEEEKAEILKIINNEDPDLILGQFTSVLNAGKASSFSTESQIYNEAIIEVDQYIGEIKKAVESRKTYDKEDWLIIITSSHGGKGNSYGGESIEERNNFSLYYNKSFKEQKFVANTIISPRFYGYNTTDANPTNALRGRNTTSPAGENSYNISTTGEMTIEAKIKINKNASGNYSYSWPPFLSKVNSRTGKTPGWSFFRSGINVVFWCADGSTAIEATSKTISVDDMWAHITGVVTKENGIPTFKFYTNGVLSATVAEPKMDISKITSSSPLTFGFQGDVFSTAYLDFYMTDVHIWNVALSDKEIEENANRIGVSESHPKINNLIGNWSLEEKDKMFTNKVANRPNIPIVGTPVYSILENNLPFVDTKVSRILKSQDIPMQILYWFNLSVNNAWKLSGNNFLKNYEIEFIKN